MSAAVVAELEAALPGRVTTDPAALRALSTDRSGHVGEGLPLAAVHAESVEDVQQVCRTASGHATPVVTRGAGTGLAGGATAGDGEIVLSLERMDRVLEISPQNRLAVVQAGVINGRLDEQLAAHGLWWSPDPASKDISTVGGNIAMNAGGLLCAKYGVTRESVLGLTVVLADGRRLDVGHRTVKGVTGYDLTALMIGSEGTLGIIVEATLKLRPAVSGETPTLTATFSSIVDAAAASSALVHAGHIPAAMELLDRPCLDALTSFTGEDPSQGGKAFLLLQCDGESAAAELQACATILQSHGGHVQVARDQAEAQRLFGLRRQMFPALEARGTPLIEDVAVPLDRMADAFAEIRRIEQDCGVLIPTAAHAGDGNLHPTFSFEGHRVPERIWEAAGRIFEMALAMGGTLTGEHGVGLLKRRWLVDELGADQFALQRQIKELFDPAGILNPGKVFAELSR
ncbi:FAD-linked oxidase C-terminal domain-containing protein [Nesterenkonia sp. CL21]|uniref:FAD-binding oxidoreductase n=1 Tax=Nesterenkonia sp. CL21 TaxID=3064894 RepID=UPI002878EFE6|nr:FAD-linked oxidase C-terminal domain-containing protein [Nesterenkonia sp. CL21]MDS2174008.1 FAD-linked oxidase C-terminal domain-containing protein [Nesterenkonia sp. CL21]